MFDAHVDAIRREGRALAASARAAGLDAIVPSCPDWTVTDLLGHIGRIHHYVARLARDQSADRGEHWSASEPPSADTLLDWYSSGVDELANTLHECGPAVEVFSWTPDKTTAFWARRQAVETAVHRVDADLAAGQSDPVDAALAIDGIDELFWLIPYWPWADRVRGNGETLHFHATDGDGEWLVRLGADGIDVRREHAKGDVAARGTASELLLFLYGRNTVDALQVFGDETLLAQWRALVAW